MHIVLWNGFSNSLEIFRGGEEEVQEMASDRLKLGDDVIYFYAMIESITLRDD